MSQLEQRIFQKEPMRTQSKNRRGKTRLTKSWLVLICVSWLVEKEREREWRNFPKLITKRRKARPLQFGITFGTQPSIALILSFALDSLKCNHELTVSTGGQDSQCLRPSFYWHPLSQLSSSIPTHFRPAAKRLGPTYVELEEEIDRVSCKDSTASKSGIIASFYQEY